MSLKKEILIKKLEQWDSWKILTCLGVKHDCLLESTLKNNNGHKMRRVDKNVYNCILYYILVVNKECQQ